MGDAITEGGMQSQRNRLEREGETTMIHLGARHDIIKEMISKPETWHDVINKACYHKKMISNKISDMASSATI